LEEDIIFLSMSKIITGIDIGSAFVKGVVAESHSNGELKIISVLKQPSRGLRKGVLVDADETRSMLRDLTKELRYISRDAVKNVFINTNSEHVKVRISQGISAVSQPDKEIKEDDIERAVQASRAAKVLPNYKVLHVITREFMVDDIGDIQDPVGMTGSRIEISTLIVESFAPHFDILTNAVEEAGMTVSGCVFNPFADERAVLSKQQKELGVILIDLGAGTTSVVMFEEQKPLFAKSFPIGASHITNDIAVGLKISVEMAEQLKREFGNANSKKVSRRDVIQCEELSEDFGGEISRRFLAEIIEVRVSEIIDIIRDELNPIMEKFRFPSGVVLTGGGVKLQGVAEIVRRDFGLPVQIGVPNVGAFEIENPRHEERVHDPEFVTATGLVLIGSDETQKKKNGTLQALRRVVRSVMP
jgi:cell division protein FtsA